jgi:ADP-heptose:LPS heptosyltransferase
MDKAERQEITPQTLVAEFLSAFHGSGNYLREPIDALARLALSEDAEVMKAATGAIFTSLVEVLADSFEPKAVTLYNRLFAHLIHFCRHTAQGERLDKELTNFGILREEDLLARAERLRHTRQLRKSFEDRQKIIRAVVLSRVTIGADVAVTSVIIERLKKEFPNAEIVFVGGSKTAELFGGDGRIRRREITYQRAGTLTERLSSWLEVLHCARQLTEGLSADEYLIVDPDSRLTQLGLLPLVAENFFIKPNADGQTRNPINQPAVALTGKAGPVDNYLFFPSRELGHRTTHSLSELTSFWLNAVFGGEETTLPCLSLKPADKELAGRLVGRMRQGDERSVVAINFGVGENLMKRLSDEFEKQLVGRLIENGVRIIFDKGAGDAEIKRANLVLEEARHASHRSREIRMIDVDEISIQTLLREEEIDADAMVWQGRIGMLAALIGESDLYIGYDSAGQHIAAALGVPCIDVFAGFSSSRMLERWRPTGSAKTCAIGVDSLKGDVNTDAILRDVILHAEDFLNQNS